MFPLNVTRNSKYRHHLLLHCLTSKAKVLKINTEPVRRTPRSSASFSLASFPTFILYFSTFTIRVTLSEMPVLHTQLPQQQVLSTRIIYPACLHRNKQFAVITCTLVDVFSKIRIRFHEDNLPGTKKKP